MIELAGSGFLTQLKIDINNKLAEKKQSSHKAILQAHVKCQKNLNKAKTLRSELVVNDIAMIFYAFADGSNTVVRTLYPTPVKSAKDPVPKKNVAGNFKRMSEYVIKNKIQNIYINTDDKSIGIAVLNKNPSAVIREYSINEFPIARSNEVAELLPEQGDLGSVFYDQKNKLRYWMSQQGIFYKAEKTLTPLFQITRLPHEHICTQCDFINQRFFWSTPRGLWYFHLKDKNIVEVFSRTNKATPFFVVDAAIDEIYWLEQDNIFKSSIDTTTTAIKILSHQGLASTLSLDTKTKALYFSFFVEKNTAKEITDIANKISSIRGVIASLHIKITESQALIASLTNRNPLSNMIVNTNGLKQEIEALNRKVNSHTAEIEKLKLKADGGNTLMQLSSSNELKIIGELGRTKDPITYLHIESKFKELQEQVIQAHDLKHKSLVDSATKIHKAHSLASQQEAQANLNLTNTQLQQKLKLENARQNSSMKKTAIHNQLAQAQGKAASQKQTALNQYATSLSSAKNQAALIRSNASQKASSQKNAANSKLAAAKKH